MWEIIQGFSHGFHISFQGDLRYRAIPDNHPSFSDNFGVAMEIIQKEIILGHVAGPFTSLPLPNFVTSPLGLIPKAEPGAFCVIHDLSFPKGNSIN